MKQMDLLPRQLVQDLVGRLLLIIVNISGVSFLSRALRGKSVYTPFSLNFFNRQYRLLFVIVTSSSFSCCCIAARYPALNMLTALRLALKASLVIVGSDLRSSSLASSNSLWYVAI